MDDGSTDKTWYKIEDLKKKYSFINGIKLSKNFGKENALMCGLNNIKNEDFIITIDADLQHPLDEIEKICTHVAILKQGELVAEGTVKDVLMDEDIIEIGCHSTAALDAIVQNIPGFIQLEQKGDWCSVYFEKGTADTAAVNAYCFAQGITLNHLVLKKKRLEDRFFELTAN